MDDLLQVIVPTVSLVGGWLLGKKKRTADIRMSDARADSTELDAIEKAVKIWRSLAEELKKEVDQLRGLIEELRIENDKLREEIDELKRKTYVD